MAPELLASFERIAGFEEVPLTTLLRQALVHYVASDDAARRLFRAHRAEAPDEPEAER